MRLYCSHSGQDEETVARALERDNFMSPEQAQAFGLIDEVVQRREGPPPAIPEHK